MSVRLGEPAIGGVAAPAPLPAAVPSRPATRLGSQSGRPALLLDRPYEGAGTRDLARAFDYEPIVRPHPNRAAPWRCDREPIATSARPYRRLTRFRWIPTSDDKLNVMSLCFIHLALTYGEVRIAWTGLTGQWQVVARHL